MQDSSRWSKLVVLQPEQRNITRKLFWSINLAAKKRFLCYLLTMIKDWWVKNPKKKRWRTLIIYPARKNSEKRHIRENVTISILNKKSLPRNVCPNFNLAIWANVQKRWERSTRLERWQRSKTCQTFLTFHFIYIYRYLANKQLFSFIVNTFIHWIFNVIFHPVHHHCHPFTDFYKRLTFVEFKPFFLVRKSDTFIFWKACLLIVPAGLDPRTYNIGTLHNRQRFNFENRSTWWSIFLKNITIRIFWWV